jgi:transcriptional regulator with XRE-family HTH domain
MELLRKEMKLKGYTSAALSLELGIEPPTITAWFKGLYKPTPYIITKMKRLGFSDTACLEPSKEIEI